MRREINLMVVVLSVLCMLLIAGNSFSQWQADVRLTDNTENSINCFGNTRSVAANGDIIHTVWTDYRDGNSEIYYKRSVDGGITWGSDVRLTSNPASAHNPGIVVNGSSVYVVFYENRNGDFQVFLMKSADDGVTWGAETQISESSVRTGHPSIAVSGSNVHVAWWDNRDGVNEEIYYRKSADGGFTWSPEVRITNNAGRSIYANVAVSGSYVHVIWQDDTPGNWEIYYKRSADGGSTWGTETRLTNNQYVTHIPSIAVSGANIYILFGDGRNGSMDIYFKKSANNGSTWGSDTRLTTTAYNEWFSSVAVNSADIYVVFRQDISANSYKISYLESNNSGSKWSKVTALTSSVECMMPSVCASGLNKHIVWRDYRDGNYEMYYKRYINNSRAKFPEFVSSGIPSEFKLKQNYPNPFNPVTTIGFDIAKAGFVTIKIYDMLGRETAELVNENMNPGSFYVNWNASGKQSGVYFCRITANGFTDIKKLLLVK
jgi:hypothetical protein